MWQNQFKTSDLHSNRGTELAVSVKHPNNLHMDQPTHKIICENRGQKHDRFSDDAWMTDSIQFGASALATAKA